MRKAWVAAALSLVTIAGGHLYNRRPYTAILFIFFAVALQSLADGLVPTLTSLGVAAADGTFRLMAWSKGTVLVIVAVASALSAFSDARAGRVHESENLKTVAAIAGALIGLRFAASAVITVITIARFNAG